MSGDYVRVAQTVHPENEIARFEGPVLIIHGDDDKTIPYEYGVKAKMLYKNAKLVTIHGADHCFEMHLEELENAIKDNFSYLR